jgi:hypothetical protein
VDEFIGKVIIAAVLTLAIKGGVALFHHWIAWWLAALISIVVVFGGFLILDGDDISSGWH